MLDVDVRGDDLVEVVAPAAGVALFNQAETRVGVGACFFLTDHPPAVTSLHVQKMTKVVTSQNSKFWNVILNKYFLLFA